MISLTPPFRIYIIIMITGCGNRNFIEIRIRQNRCCSHKTTSGMSVNPHPIQINKRISISQLFDHELAIRQSIIPQISIPETVIISSPGKTTTPKADIHHDKTQLSQRLVSIIIQRERLWNKILLRSRIHVHDNRVLPCRIHIKRPIHHAIKIRHPICRFHSYPFRLLPSRLVQQTQIGTFQFHDFFPLHVP